MRGHIEEGDILDCIMFGGVFELALRGHNESK